MTTRGVMLFLIACGTIYPSMSEESIALRKNVTRSGTNYRMQLGATNAVDGDSNQTLASSTCTDSLSNGGIAWWRVDLGELSNIHNITIYFRESSSTNNAGYRLYVSNTTRGVEVTHNGILCFEDKSNTEAEFQLTVNHVCSYVTRYVTVYNFRNAVSRKAWYNDSIILAICEVEVFGCSLGKYGNGDCSENCLNCYGGACNPTTGICLYGCITGKHGGLCQNNCSANCQQIECNVSTGHCFGCKQGFHGVDCYKKCPTNCKNNTCIQETGHCSECKVGYYSDHCDRVCSPGCRTNVCNQVDGYCPGRFNITAVVIGSTLGLFILILVILHIMMARHISRIESATMTANSKGRSSQQTTE